MSEQILIDREDAETISVENTKSDVTVPTEKKTEAPVWEKQRN